MNYNNKHFYQLKRVESKDDHIDRFLVFEECYVQKILNKSIYLFSKLKTTKMNSKFSVNHATTKTQALPYNLDKYTTTL